MSEPTVFLLQHQGNKKKNSRHCFMGLKIINKPGLRSIRITSLQLHFFSICILGLERGKNTKNGESWSKKIKW